MDILKKLIIVANASKEHVRKFCIPFIDQLHKNGWTVDVIAHIIREMLTEKEEKQLSFF